MGLCAEKKEKCNCAALQQALGAIPGAERMVVGHTIQAQGINTACDNKVYRIDVGLSKGCGNGPPEVSPSQPLQLSTLDPITIF